MDVWTEAKSYLLCNWFRSEFGSRSSFFLTCLLIASNIWHDRFYHITDFTCKFVISFYDSCMQISTCISAIITVERSLKIIFPFIFKTKGMQKRLKIVTLVSIVLQPLVQFITLYYNRSYNGDDCDLHTLQLKGNYYFPQLLSSLFHSVKFKTHCSTLWFSQWSDLCWEVWLNTPNNSTKACT